MHFLRTATAEDKGLRLNAVTQRWDSIETSTIMLLKAVKQSKKKKDILVQQIKKSVSGLKVPKYKSSIQNHNG